MTEALQQCAAGGQLTQILTLIGEIAVSVSISMLLIWLCFPGFRKLRNIRDHRAVMGGRGFRR